MTFASDAVGSRCANFVRSAKALKETVREMERRHAMLVYLDVAWPGPLIAQGQSTGEKARAWAAALGQKGRTIQRALRL